MTLAIFCLCTMAWACASNNAKVDGGARQGQEEPPGHVVTAAPRTISVELDDETRTELQRRLSAGSLTVARLVIRDVRPQAAQALKGVRIFIEKPDADVNTPVEDLHYASSFVLGLTSPESTLLNVAPTLMSLSKSGELTREKLNQQKAIRITFVPEPWDFARRLPPDFALTVASVALEIPRQR